MESVREPCEGSRHFIENGCNYSNRKFPYPRGKLYSEFPTPGAVRSGKSPTLSRGTLGVSLDNPITHLEIALLISKFLKHTNYLDALSKSPKTPCLT